jgi:hypothetical protein
VTDADHGIVARQRRAVQREVERVDGADGNAASVRGDEVFADLRGVVRRADAHEKQARARSEPLDAGGRGRYRRQIQRELLGQHGA